jgi:hypothetical protein
MAITGKGVYVYELNRFGGKNPKDLVAKLRAAGFTRVYLKIADGSNSWPSQDDFNAAVAKEAKSAGLTVWGWHYVYGNHPEDEATIAASRTKALGLTGYIYDAEIQYENKAKHAAATTFMTNLKQKLPAGTILGFSSFKYPSNHPDLPWKTFAAPADVLMPQVYWVRANNPAVQTDKAIGEWQALNANALMVPTGAAYEEDGWRADAVDVKAFLLHAKDKCKAADLWYWDDLAKDSGKDYVEVVTAVDWT